MPVVQMDYASYIGVEIAEDVTMYHSDSALIRANISGPEFIRYTNVSAPYEKFPKGVHVIFYDKRSQPESWLFANSAIRDQLEEKVTVEGDVLLYNNLGDTLETSQLIWEEKTGKIYTHRFVKLTKPDRIIMGYGFESNQEFSKGHIKAVEGNWAIDFMDGNN